MARKVLIQIRRGIESAIGTLAIGELGYCTDTSKLYIGSTTGNVLLVAAQSSGDMLKSIYDTNNDGKVDYAANADAVPWSGVAGKPSALPAAGGASDAINILDTRSVVDKPSDLQSKKLTSAFKALTAVGSPRFRPREHMYTYLMCPGGLPMKDQGLARTNCNWRKWVSLQAGTHRRYVE